MELVTVRYGGGTRAGRVEGDDIVLLDWPSVREVLAEGGLDQAAAAEHGSVIARSEADLAPVVPNPDKIVCVGVNYADHIAEMGRQAPEFPTYFGKYRRALIGPNDDIVLPDPEVSASIDWECELAVIIGKGGRGIAEADALGHVAGYSVINEGSLRDYQFKSSQWVMGKTFDRSGAFGPDIVTVDELPPGAAGLKLFCRLNDKTVQEGDTDDMIFSVARIVSELSIVMTLEPGDVISTGTPPGVGLGRKPPLWMKPGDVCEVEIEQIGVLRNLVIDEG